MEIHIHNLRDYTLDKWRRVDDYPFGGSAGMVMQCEPIDRCISALTAERHYDQIIFTAPDGERFDQPMANSLSLCENLIILCGHYKGIDYRIREHLITKEVSIGDYVLTGGELAPPSWPMPSCVCCPEPLVTSRAPFPTASRTICSRHLSIPDRPTTRAGRCPTSCFLATRPR